MKRSSTFLTLSFALLITPIASADQGPSGATKRDHKKISPIERFDENADGHLSYEEFSKSKKLENVEEDSRRKLFQHLDKNTDGLLDKSELPMRKDKSPRGGDHHERMKKMDTNNDRQVDLEEFLADYADEKSIERRTLLFKKLDMNNDGVLSREDRDASGRDRPHKPERGHRPSGRGHVIQKLDTDGDEAVSLEEFRLGKRAQRMNPDEAERLFNHLDTNGDGVIDKSDPSPETKLGDD